MLSCCMYCNKTVAIQQIFHNIDETLDTNGMFICLDCINECEFFCEACHKTINGSPVVHYTEKEHNENVLLDFDLIRRVEETSISKIVHYFDYKKRYHRINRPARIIIFKSVSVDLCELNYPRYETTVYNLSKTKNKDVIISEEFYTHGTCVSLRAYP